VTASTPETPYTPTTAVIRNGYLFHRFHPYVLAATTLEQFDRWLAAHDAEVAAKAWAEGEAAGVDNQLAWDGWRHAKGFPIINPYKAKESQ